MTNFESPQSNPKASSEKIREFWNSRGEAINDSLRLLTDPERSQTWTEYAQATMPREVFKEFGLIDSEGSEEWLNVVEHSMAVTAQALALSYALLDAGKNVDIDTVERAAWAHDASKRRDVASRISREDEAVDEVLARVLYEHGYSGAEIKAAKNTGRLADHYIEDEAERSRAINSRSIEENIVGYVDARMRGSRMASIDDARDDSVWAKPKDEEFFRQNWHPYYKSVEAYLQAYFSGFEPESLTDDAGYRAIQRRLAGESKDREKYRFYVEAYTVGKGGENVDPIKNEDVYGLNEDVIALADGATGKNELVNEQISQVFNGLTGGRIAAEVATKEVVESGLNGGQLVSQISAKINELCAANPAVSGMEGALLATLAAARLDQEAEEVVITQVGDTAVRVTYKDGTQKMYAPERTIDAVDAENRAKAIKEALKTGMNITDAAAHGREAIRDSLLSQGEYRNNPDHEYGFGCITADGVPDKFIRQYRFPVDMVETIELITDGYLYASQDEFPKEASIAAWEEHIQRVHAEDPQKYLKYLATKVADDRTILIARIQ
jgi:HD superfamily phosphodiesterase